MGNEPEKPEKPNQDLVIVHQLALLFAPVVERASQAQETAARLEFDRFKLGSEFQER